MSRGKNPSPTPQLRDPVLIQCGHHVAGMPFPAGLWVLCDRGIFCIPEGDPETPSEEIRTFLISALEQEARPAVL